MKTDGVVEISQKAPWIGHEVDCGALMRNDAAAVNVKFVLPGFAAENGMVFKDQTFRTGPCLAKKERGGRESADSAADYYAVVEFTSVSRVFQECGGICVPQFMPGAENLPGIAIAVCVFTDAPVSVPVFRGTGKRGVWLFGEKLRGRKLV